VSRAYTKQDVPPEKIRRYLEPGPIVLVSSSWEGRRNIMTMGWHVSRRSGALLAMEPN
jgi:flavin reductase (DIM6/NTAB) family NADH-FMN oxidoreductase RutF